MRLINHRLLSVKKIAFYAALSVVFLSSSVSASSDSEKTYNELMAKINALKRQQGLSENQPLLDGPAQQMFGKGVDELTDAEFNAMMRRIRESRS